MSNFPDAKENLMPDPRLTGAKGTPPQLGPIDKSVRKRHLGMVQVYTGNGKGKTTAALGQALRAAGRGFNVAIYQLMKPTQSSGEHFFFNDFNERIKIIPLGLPRWIRKDATPDPEDVDSAVYGLAEAQQDMLSGQTDMLIMDELNPAVYFGLVDLNAALNFIKARPPHVELIITGRQAPEEILALADLITIMAPERHPFKWGVPAREGIEY